MQRKTPQPKKGSFFDSVIYFPVAGVIFFFSLISGRWPNWIEKSSWWKRILWVTATNNFAKEHDPLEHPDANAVSFFKLELIVILLLMIVVALPGPSPIWTTGVLIFAAWVCDRIRAAIKGTYGGVKIAFDTGGKVVGFIIFGGIYGLVIATILGYIIFFFETF